jgi:acyl carrier protein
MSVMLTDRNREVGDAEGVCRRAGLADWSTSEVELLTRLAVGYRPARRHGRLSRMEMEASVAEVRGRVLSVIKSILESNDVTADVQPDSHLVDIGLSSMDMVALMLRVEAEFEIMLPQCEITPENFKSVRTLETVILNQLGAGCASERRRSPEPN